MLATALLVYGFRVGSGLVSGWFRPAIGFACGLLRWLFGVLGIVWSWFMVG